MILIDSEDIKQAIIENLLILFPGVAVYKEAKTAPEYPHFFVYQINFTDDEERKDFHLLNFYIDVRYRVASDPSTDLKLQQNLDNIGLKLTQGFNWIDFEDEKVFCKDKKIEKEDGVLHFFFTIQILAKLVEDNDAIKMNKMDVEIETEE